MPFWSGEKILDRQKQHDLVSEFDESRVDCNSYRIRMGNEYYCTSDARRKIWDVTKKKFLSPLKPFTIAPGQFGFLLSKETVTIPNDAMAFISMRAKAKFRGLINVSGFHVDPGYNGKLIFSVFNAGSSHIHLSEDEELFLIWFADLDRPSKKIRQTEGYKTIPNDLINGMNREVVSLYSFANDLSSLKNTMRVQAIIFGASVTFFFGLLGFSVNYIIQHRLESIVQQANSTPVEVHLSGQPLSPVSPPKPPLPGNKTH